MPNHPHQDPKRTVHIATLILLLGLNATWTRSHAQNFADRVLQYSPGAGFATDFTTGAGYTNASTLIGAPSRSTPGDFGGPVDPFNPPWQNTQLLSIGAGGSITFAFQQPVPNQPSNPFGIDFILFGSAGFTITNGNYTGGGITDGSTFGGTSGTTRIAVSRDGATFFVLDPSKTPTPDSLFPSDGAGDPTIPVNPGLNAANFAGHHLAGIRTLYAGSAGGTGFDISWARDADGNPANLDAIQFVRLEVLTDHVELDGVSAVPEPAVIHLLALGTCAGIWRIARRRVNGRNSDNPCPAGPVEPGANRE